MKLSTLCFFLATVAQSAVTSTYSSSVFMAAVSTSSVALVNAKSFDNPDTGFCTGGNTYCEAFENGCPYPYCQIGDTTDECVGGYDNPWGYFACSVLSEYECKHSSRTCNFVTVSTNQKAINAVLVAFTTTSLVVLMLIAVLLCRRLPVPKKEESELTQSLLNEQNA